MCMYVYMFMHICYINAYTKYVCRQTCMYIHTDITYMHGYPCVYVCL